MTGAVPPQLPGLTVVRQLGQGGYSDVFLYEQQMPRRQIAVKVLRVAGLTDALRRRFTTEADTMAGLGGHPNIVPVFSADIAADGRPYLTMLFCPRANLAERAAREPFGVSEVLRVGVQIGGAIETAHRANVLHRDIKPANILTDQYDVPRLADFGIAGELAAADDDPELGVSVHFAPPEVLYDTARPSVASDVYSFAATLWTLLIGRPPFSIARHDTTPELMERVRSAPPRPTGRADVPPSFERLLAQALSKNPAVRPRSALDFVLALQQIEQELRLPVTRVFVETPEVTAARPDAQGNETRVRAPRVTGPERPAASTSKAIWAQPPPPAVTSPAPVRGDPATVRRAAAAAAPPSPARRERVLPDQGPSAGTMHRATQVAPPAEVSAARRGVPRPVAIGAGVVVVAVAVVIGLLIAGSGDGSKPTDTSTTPVGLDTAADQDPGGDSTPLGAVMVTATRISASQVRYSWLYDGARDDDTFLWQTTTGSTPMSVPTPSVVVDVAAGTTTCVEVKVVRQGGARSSVVWSTPVCSS